MQEMGMSILYDSDTIAEFVEDQKSLISSLKLALLANDSRRLPALFPAFAPPIDNEAAIKAADTDAPVEIVSEVSSAEAADILQQMGLGGSLDLSDIERFTVRPEWETDY